MKKQIGNFEVDLARVQNFHYDEQGNLEVTFDGDSEITFSPNDALHFMALWNERSVTKSSPPPAP